MKKIISLLLVLTLMLGLAACGGSNETTPGGDQPAETQNQGGSAQQTQPQTQPQQPAFSGEITEEILRGWPETPASDFSYENSLEFDGIKVTAYHGSEDIVVIPAQIDGKNVVEVVSLCFGNDSTVRAVRFPETVTSCWGVFSNNNCVEIVIAEGLQEIGYATFLDCKSLHTILLSDHITAIGESAFANCFVLKELRLPDYLVDPDEEDLYAAFFGCMELTIYGDEGSMIQTIADLLGISFVAE